MFWLILFADCRDWVISDSTSEGNVVDTTFVDYKKFNSLRTQANSLFAVVVEN